MWIVDVELVESWLLGLDQDSYEPVIAALELLAERGPQLGHPLVDTEVRERHAVLLVAGDKAGNWTRWYKTNIPIADELFDDHLRILKGGS